MAFIGLEGLHYAIMTQEETSSTPPTYDTPKRLIGVRSVSVESEIDKATLYGDNQALATKINKKKDTVTLEVARVPLEDRAAILGHSYDSDTNVMSVKAGDTAPNVAIMYELDTDEDKKEYHVFYKGKFSASGHDADTRGENTEFKSHTLVGEFVARIDNKKSEDVKIVESSDTTFATAFYSAVGGGL